MSASAEEISQDPPLRRMHHATVESAKDISVELAG